MKINFKMLRHHYLKILTVIFIVILHIFSFSQYKAKELYKAHISNRLNTDVQNLVTSIQNNNKLYDEILNNGRISKAQVNSLMWSNESIRDILLEYRGLAVELKMRSEEFQYDKSSLNAIKISRLFYDWDETYESELNAKTKLIISKAQELNSKWISSIKTPEGHRYSLSDPSWLELIENIEKNTHAYLKENHMDNIEELWLERTEIK